MSSENCEHANVLLNYWNNYLNFQKYLTLGQMGFGGEMVWESLINMKLTLHSQNLPGFKYFCPDFQNQ